MELWEILVPTKRNNGKPFRTRHHREWDKRVRRLATGLTIFKPAKGQWISGDGTLYEDRMIPVRIACTKNQIYQIADMSLKHYDQVAIMFYPVSSEVVYRYAPRDS